MSTILAVVVPCYNEVEALPETIKQLSEVLEELIVKEQVSNLSYLCFVDDGSIDGTWEIFCE